MIAYLLGILSVANIPQLSLSWWLAPVLLLLSIRRCVRSYLLQFVLGMLVATLYGHWQLYHRYDNPPRTFVMQAEIIGLPQARVYGYTMILRPLHVMDAPSAIRHLRLVSASYYGTDHNFEAGQQLKVEIRLKPPRGFSNPAGFDLERAYLSRGIDARGHVRAVLEQTYPDSGSVSGRQWLAQYLDQSFTTVTAATLKALVLGDRSGLSEQQWQWLRVTGTAHLFVVSGLHVAVLAALGWWSGRALLLLPLIAGLQGNVLRMVPPLCAVSAAAGYGWLSGWGIPVQRAWVMLVVFMLGSLLLQPMTGWQRWRLALVVIVTLQPLAVMEVGTWLSFGAVALILWYLQHQNDRPGMVHVVSGWAGVQFVLFVGMLPVMAASFHQLSLLSIPVNLVLVPLVSLAIWALPLLMFSTLWVGGEGLATQLVESCVEGVWAILAWCAQIPGLHTEVAAPVGMGLLAAILGALCLLLPMPLLYRMLALPILVPLLSVAGHPTADSGFRAVLFDVGQGQALLIETAEGAVLYDTGPGYFSGGSAFSYTVQPWLEARGIRQLDTLVLSHGDSDHGGGYAALKAVVEIDKVYSGEPEQYEGSVACTGQSWELGGIQFRFMQAFSDPEGLSANNRSCVLQVESVRCRLLVTGDLDASGEYRLLSSGYRAPLTWMVAGHHGSRDSTSGAMLDLLKPQWVLVSAGRYNRFGHPHDAVIDRLASRSIPWMMTASSGAIEMVADSEQCSTYPYREQKKRYWTAS